MDSGQGSPVKHSQYFLLVRFLKLWTPIIWWISCYLISPKLLTQSLIINSIITLWHTIKYTSMDSHMAHYQNPKSYVQQNEKKKNLKIKGSYQEYHRELFWDTTDLPHHIRLHYVINKQLLQVVDQYVYLEVKLHSSMSWSHHLQAIINKATKILNNYYFAKQTLYQCDAKVKATAYTTLV